MKIKDRLNKIFEILANEFSEAKIDLKYSSGFELLAATVLSAQCTDERVNQVTEVLFSRYKSIKEYAEADIEELEQIIYSTGFYKAKAKNIKALAGEIIERYKGEIPNSMEELILLPGVGRKTANVVLGHYFDNPVGVVVDTHVKRIAKLLELTKQTDPEKIEIDLLRLLDKSQRVMFTHYIIRLGRSYCKARKRNCSQCPINLYCPSSEV